MLEWIPQLLPLLQQQKNQKIIQLSLNPHQRQSSNNLEVPIKREAKVGAIYQDPLTKTPLKAPLNTRFENKTPYIKGHNKGVF